MALKVALSPFFNGDAWQDELTGINFEKSSAIGTVTTYDLSRVAPEDLKEIRRAIRLNALIIVEGDIEPEAVPQAPKAKEETKQAVPVEEVPDNVEVVASEEEVAAEEPKKVAPKKK